MSDQDRGRAERALDLAQFDLHLLAQLGVQIRQRLVEQEHARPDYQRASERHALLLAAGHAARMTLLIARKSDNRERCTDALRTLGARHPPHLEAEGDIFRGGHMWE